MLAVRSFEKAQDVVDFIQGTRVAAGQVGTNTAGSPNFSDATSGAFTDVVAGDDIYISGETATSPFNIDTVTNPNALVLSANVVAAHVANAHWRITRGGVGEAAVKFGGPMIDADGKYILFYATTTF